VTTEPPAAPVLAGVSPHASADELAAIVAAIGACAWVAEAPEPGVDDTLHEWVSTARIRARRAGVQRGPWRFSGRVGRRSRV
jgi:hypothetical protein